jgi:predicted PurR-regulated permease PerM
MTVETGAVRPLGAGAAPRPGPAAEPPVDPPIGPPPGFTEPAEDVAVPPASEIVKQPRHPLAVPLWGIFLLGLVGALVYAADFLVPLSIAVLLNFILNGPRRALGRLGLPAPAFAALVTLTLGIGVVAVGMLLAEPIGSFVQSLPSLLDRVAETLTAPDGPLAQFNAAAEATDEMLGGAPEAAPPAEAAPAPAAEGSAPVPEEVVSTAGIATSVVALAPGLLSQIVFAICMLFFLIASGDLFIRRAVQAADRLSDKKRTVQTWSAIEAKLGAYLGAITLINAGLGVAIGLAMWWWGLPSPWLIGMMAALLNFVPFVGAVLGALIAALIGFIEYVDLWKALGVLATYYALTAFEGQFVTPALVSQRLRLNTAVLFLTVAFFAWVWSIMGMIVAVPMLIVLKILCDATPALRKLGLFLGEAEGFGTPNERDAGREH